LRRGRNIIPPPRREHEAERGRTSLLFSVLQLDNKSKKYSIDAGKPVSR
jgi:hypothetical protein